MKAKLACRRLVASAFTLVELLVVIAIIGILAAMLVPAIIAGNNRAKAGMARTQIGRIELALSGYEAFYSQLPVSSNARTAAAANGGSFTYGGTFSDAAGNPIQITTPGYTADNSEVMGVLLDVESFAGTPTINVGHVKNTKGEKFLTELRVTGKDRAGIGDDGVFRDYWGNPYLISLNLDGNDRCADAFYRRQSVSQTVPGSAAGFEGLVNNSGTPNSDAFTRAGKFMVWSVGPDKRADVGVKANAGVNKDNVIGWK